MTEHSHSPRVRLSRLRDIGWSLWDPIGLLGFDGQAGGRWSDEENLHFADEYDSYLIDAALQLSHGKPRDEVVGFLVKIEADHMGLGHHQSARQRAEAVVDAILSDRDLWVLPDAQGRVPESG